MIKEYPLIGLFIIALINPALLNAAPIIEGDPDVLSFFQHPAENPLQGAIEMNGVTGINTPANNDVFLYSFNGFGETFLEFETGDFISLIDGVYTWEGGGYITQTGALGIDISPNGDSENYIVPDITFLTGDWTGPITGQIEEDSGFLLISGFGTDVKDQTLLDFYGILDNSWQFSFELSVALEHLIFEPDGSFFATAPTDFSLSFNNINTDTAVPAPTTFLLFMIGLVTLVFYHACRKRSTTDSLFDSAV